MKIQNSDLKSRKEKKDPSDFFFLFDRSQNFFQKDFQERA
jgi:hypothetical protein